MEPDTLRLTELRYCRAEDDEVVTIVAEADVTALAQGWPVREFAWHLIRATARAIFGR